MKNKSIVSEKGQVTLPKAIRDRHGIHPGVEIEFRSQNGVVTILKIVRKSGLDKWYGRVKNKKLRSTDEYLRRIRDANSN